MYSGTQKNGLHSLDCNLKIKMTAMGLASALHFTIVETHDIKS